MKFRWFIVPDWMLELTVWVREAFQQGALAPACATHTFRGEGGLGEVKQTEAFAELKHLLDEI